MKKSRAREMLLNELFNSVNGICEECGEPAPLAGAFKCEGCEDGPHYIPSRRVFNKWVLMSIECALMIMAPPIISFL